MNLGSAAQSFLIGAVSGILSGAFGIGGGIVTTPAIRLILKAPALVAVGTPLPVIIPGALTGAWTYFRRDLLDVRAAVTVGVVGSAASIVGAWLSKLAGGSAVMLATAALIVYVAIDTSIWAAKKSHGRHDREPVAPTVPRVATVGLAAGLYSGFLGLGGGFVIVPLLARWLGFDMKKAVGTSLLSVAILAIPGSVAHYLLGHVDLTIALGLAVGVVPGAAVGSRLTVLARETAVRYAFAAMLVCVAVWLVVGELGTL
ncbi:MAG: sulfite exporter TauE/SafE family protein [Anaerosomatales bacterium]|nr:sulfite exporter TauE/SafE family protein [Anaerosomatales bacterium]